MPDIPPIPYEVRDLLLELVNDPPIAHCADDGSSCAFCGADYNYSAFWPGGTGVPCVHSTDCWLIKAREILKSHK